MSFALPAARLALMRLLRSRVRTRLPNASTVIDPAFTSSNASKPLTSACKSIGPKSVSNLRIVPFRKVAPSQLNGEPSGKSRERGRKGANACNRRCELSGAREKHKVEIGAAVVGAVEDRTPPANNHKLYARINQQLDCGIDAHRLGLRAAPRTRSAASDTSCIWRARSAGVSLNWPISSVKSMPYFLAASMRLPGGGFRSLSAARANSSGVNARSSFTH